MNDNCLALGHAINRTCSYINFFVDISAANTWKRLSPAHHGHILDLQQTLNLVVAEFGDFL